MFCGTAINWATTAAMLQGIGAILGVIVAGVAAIFAARSFSQWRRQQLIQRHMALAERLITVAYRSRQEIRKARSIVRSREEAAAAKAQLDQEFLEDNGFSAQSYGPPSLDHSRKKVVTRILENRLKSGQEIWDDLEGCKPLAVAYFADSEIPDLIDRFMAVKSELGLAATLYAGSEATDPETERSLRLKLFSLRFDHNTPNEIETEVNAIVKRIEELTSPLLREVRVNPAGEIVISVMRKSALSIVRSNLPF